MPDFLEHAPNLTVLAFHQRELIPGIVSLADDANFRGGGMNASATSIRPLLPGRFGFGIRNAFRLRAFIIPQAFGRAESVRRNCQSPPESFNSGSFGLARHLDYVNLRHMGRSFH